MRRLYVPIVIAAALSTEACGHDSCFVRGTRIATERGDVPIESLEVGDVVLSYSHSERAIVRRRVVAVHRSHVNEVRTVEVVARGASADSPGARLEVTPSHPFWVEPRGEYVAVRDLRAGDVLLLRSGGDVRQAIVTSVEARELSAPMLEVFNVSVESPESNYFAENVLVHNKEPPVHLCEDADVAVGATSRVADEDDGAARYRFEVRTPREASLKVNGFGRSPGAARADVPLSLLTATGADNGRRWTVEFVVKQGLGVTLYLSGETTASDGTSCSIGKTIDPLMP